MSEADFWRMCPRQLSRVYRGVARRRKDDLRLTIIGAYQTAVLSRAKKMPRLDTILNRIDSARSPADKRRMTWQQMETVARQWTAHLARAGQPKKG